MKKLSIIAVSLLSTVFFFSCKKDVVVLGTPTPTNTHLKLNFKSISNTPVSNPSNVTDWNAFFATSTNAVNPFTSVSVVGNQVTLNGGYGLNVKEQLFANNLFLTKVEDDSTISRTSYSSFYGCNLLKSFSSLSLKNVGDFSFYASDSLTIFTADKVDSIGLACFQGCGQLLSVNFNKVKVITNSSFYGCFKLGNVNIPNATSLEEFAFYNCTNIQTANFPLATSLGGSAFGQCNKLTIINLQSCQTIGNINYQDVFTFINGNNIHIYIPTSAILDKDIVYLQTHNIVAIN